MNEKKMSKLDLLIHLVVKIKKDDIFALSSQLAYYLVLSFFPFLIFLFTLISFSNLDAEVILEALETMLPNSVFELTQNIILEVLGTQSTGVLGISLILAIWTASSGARAVFKGVNKAYNIREERNYVKRAIISFISTIGLAITVLLSLSLLVFGDVIGNYLIDILPFRQVLIMIWNILRYGVILFILTFIFAFIYKYAPSKKIRWRDVLPGAIFATIGWVVVSIGFSFYINNYSNYSRFYGSLAAVFVLMIWLFLTSLIFMFGVEINSVRVKSREIM
ncbi:YihY/virulence factor BrkB family protein [uncultured Clostridium sp.]|uniref:YihY/virulence factor BrkB family protein n=1 Tax=uncultured Clostridium sp. TaxID=59620 RepID=UPI0025F60CC7|nr:YihY/virulence factor BrkB family protein [uncultured Clostridium sp.]